MYPPAEPLTPAPRVLLAGDLNMEVTSAAERTLKLGRVVLTHRGPPAHERTCCLTDSVASMFLTFDHVYATDAYYTTGAAQPVHPLPWSSLSPGDKQRFARASGSVLSSDHLPVRMEIVE